MEAPEDNNKIRPHQCLVDLLTPPLSRLNTVEILENQPFGGTQKSNERRNEPRILMTI